ncbi:MAG: isochorismatase hydrolase [Ilumatobacteraceae bacterium]|nr:isochorismatase hydrolase [Ilumatobacteraceae bacterium]
MPLTTLDPHPALVVIDLQNGIMGIDAVHPLADIVDRNARLVAAFRDHGLTVVLVNATGTAPGRTDTSPRTTGGAFPAGFADLIPELDVQPSDVLVSKQRWGAFHGTDLHVQLQARGVTQVIVTGVATSAGVESTARFAHEHGYHVVLVTDAMTDRSAEAHDNSVERIFPRIGETTTTAELLAALDAHTTTG